MQASKKRLFFFALGVGVLIFILALANRQSPPLNPATDRAVPVQAVAIEQKAIAPLISGFGRVQPKVEWKAVAETSGKIIYRHPDLEKGRVLKMGVTLLKIDPLDYELQLARAQAELNSSKAQLARLNLEEQNLKASLDNEEKRLSLIEKELTRKENLLNKNVLSKSDVDQQRLSFLSQQSQVLNLKNQLSLIPDNRSTSRAQVKVNESRLEEARRQLSNTKIILPFTARVASVDFEVGEAVHPQQQLALLYGVRQMEVEAQVSLHDIKTLLNSITFNSVVHPENPINYTKIRPDQFNLKSRVIISSGNYRAEREARVVRISETVDPNQGTVGVILEIDQNLRAMVNSNQVPLSSGLFVEATIEGLTTPQLLVPEAALHGNTLYRFSEQKTLDKVDITVLFRRDGVAVIDGAIKAGDMVVTTDLIPAIDGMKLKRISNLKDKKKTAEISQ